MAKTTTAPVAPVAAPKSAAAPGSAGDARAAKKKERVARTPLLAEGDAKLTHNDERLAAYDRKIHRPLKPSDFTCRSEVLRYRATLFDKQAARCRTEADRLASLGAVADSKKAKRLLALTAQIEALKASLASEGQDVSALLAAMGITPAAN